MKVVNVVAAIIIKNKKILATKRGYGEFENLWEFPGGKIEKFESAKDALKREIKEELNAEIEIEKFLININYDYPTFHLNMDCYISTLLTNFNLIEHKEARWISKDELDSIDWIPADVEIVDLLKNIL